MANREKPLSKTARGSKSHLLGRKVKKAGSESSRSHLLSDATAEAIMLLEELVSGLTSTPLEVSQIEPLLRKYKHAVRLLGGDEGWVSSELEGYPEDEIIPSYREITGGIVFISPKYYRKLSVRQSGRFFLPQSVGSLLCVDLSSDKGEITYFIGEPKKVKIGDNIHIAQEVGYAKPIQIRQILHKIAEVLFDRISKELITLKFDKLVESIFNDYQHSVDRVVAELGIGDYLQTAYQGLARSDKASWQSAALACRSMIQRLAETLWQAPGESYPYLKNKDGSGLMRVTKNEPRNRLRAYLQQKGVKGDSMLAASLDPLYAMASAGKAPITYEHAKRVLIHTYIFLGEMVIQTDMEPVMKLHEV